MEDYEASLAQGSVLFSDSVDWEVHAGPVMVTNDITQHVEMMRAGTISVANWIAAMERLQGWMGSLGEASAGMGGSMEGMLLPPSYCLPCCAASTFQEPVPPHFQSKGIDAEALTY